MLKNIMFVAGLLIAGSALAQSTVVDYDKTTVAYLADVTKNANGDTVLTPGTYTVGFDVVNEGTKCSKITHAVVMTDSEIKFGTQLKKPVTSDSAIEVPCPAGV
jgi:archaellum component FlaG (FlaF/FlaG flagellin family)